MMKLERLISIEIADSFFSDFAKQMNLLNHSFKFSVNYGRLNLDFFSLNCGYSEIKVE